MHIFTFPVLCRYEVKGCEVVWAIKHDSICHTFVDEGASVFFLPHLEEDSHTRGESASGSVVPVKRTKYVYERTREAEVGSGGEERKNEVEGGERDRVGECRRIGEEGGGMGSALGPDWQAGRAMTGSHEVYSQCVMCSVCCTVYRYIASVSCAVCAVQCIYI